MHLLGKEIKVTMTPPDGKPKTLLAIKDWDYNWQETYFFKEPLQVKAGTRFDVEAHLRQQRQEPATTRSTRRRWSASASRRRTRCASSSWQTSGDKPRRRCAWYLDARQEDAAMPPRGLRNRVGKPVHVAQAARL